MPAPAWEWRAAVAGLLAASPASRSSTIMFVCRAGLLLPRGSPTSSRASLLGAACVGGATAL